MCRLKLLLLIALSCFGTQLYAEKAAVDAEKKSLILVTDDLGNQLRLDQPASKIVSLAPHLTELVYAAGAGDQLVAVVSYSDYPAEALKLPIIGTYKKINYESLVALQPDLVLLWSSGLTRNRRAGKSAGSNRLYQRTTAADRYRSFGAADWNS